MGGERGGGRQGSESCIMLLAGNASANCYLLNSKYVKKFYKNGHDLQRSDWVSSIMAT